MAERPTNGLKATLIALTVTIVITAISTTATISASISGLRSDVKHLNETLSSLEKRIERLENWVK